VKKTTMRRLLHYIKSHPILAFLSIVFALSYVAGLILAPIFIGNAIDYIIGETQVNQARVLYYAICLLITILIAALSNYLTTAFSASLSQKITAKIRLDTMSKIVDAAQGELLNKLSRGELAVRLSTDCERIAEGLTSFITQIFTFFALIIGTLVFMFRLNVTLALVIALLSPLSVLAASIIAYFSRKMLIKQTAIEGDLARLTEEYLIAPNLSADHSIGAGVPDLSTEHATVGTGVPDLSTEHATVGAGVPDLSTEHATVEAGVPDRPHENKNAVQKSFVQHSEKIKAFGSKATFFASLTIPTTRFINGIIFAIVAIIGAYLVLGEAYFSVGMLTIFLTYTVQYTRPFNDINATISDVQGSIVSAKRVFGMVLFS